MRPNDVRKEMRVEVTPKKGDNRSNFFEYSLRDFLDLIAMTIQDNYDALCLSPVSDTFPEPVATAVLSHGITSALLAKLQYAEGQDFSTISITVQLINRCLAIRIEGIPWKHEPKPISNYWWFANVPPNQGGEVIWADMNQYYASPENGDITLPDGRFYPNHSPGWPEAVLFDNIPVTTVLGHLNAILRKSDSNPLSGLLRSTNSEVRVLAHQIAGLLTSAQAELTNNWKNIVQLNPR